MLYSRMQALSPGRGRTNTRRTRWTTQVNGVFIQRVLKSIEVFGTKVNGQLFVAQQAYKHLRDEGRLILMSSVPAQKGIPAHAIYAASKAAIQGAVRCLAWDFGPRKITVNCVASGGVKTAMYTEAAAKYILGGRTCRRRRSTGHSESGAPSTGLVTPTTL